VERTRTPAAGAGPAGNLNALAASVPKQALPTNLVELSNAFGGAGPDLQRLLDQSNAFTQTSLENLDELIGLINTSQTVLDTRPPTAARSATSAATCADSPTSSGSWIPPSPTLSTTASGPPTRSPGCFGTTRKPCRRWLTNLLSITDVRPPPPATDPQDARGCCPGEWTGWRRGPVLRRERPEDRRADPEHLPLRRPGPAQVQRPLRLPTPGEAGAQRPVQRVRPGLTRAPGSSCPTARPPTASAPTSGLTSRRTSAPGAPHHRPTRAPPTFGARRTRNARANRRRTGPPRSTTRTAASWPLPTVRPTRSPASAVPPRRPVRTGWPGC